MALITLWMFKILCICRYFLLVGGVQSPGVALTPASTASLADAEPCCDELFEDRLSPKILLIFAGLRASLSSRIFLSFWKIYKTQSSEKCFKTYCIKTDPFELETKSFRTSTEMTQSYNCLSWIRTKTSAAQKHTAVALLESKTGYMQIILAKKKTAWKFIDSW